MGDADATTERARIGRPRRYDPDTERCLLLDAGLRVIARNGLTATTVTEILSEAGLSTRAFYRHFPSSQDLLSELLERETAAVERELDAAVANAPDPVAAVEAWLNTYLDLFFAPRNAGRAAFFRSHAVLAFPAHVMFRMRKRYCRPLVGALREGHAAGLLYSPSPEADAHSMNALVLHSLETVGASSRWRAGRAAAMAHIARFVRPALGLVDHSPCGKGH